MNQNESDNSLKSKAKDCDNLDREKESPVSGFSAHGTEYVKLFTTQSGHTSEHTSELDCTPQLHPGSPVNIQAGDCHIKDMGRRSSASHEDSPVFSYVSSLSPIKPVNVRSIVQAYENIDVPSPQPVFTTPHFIRPRNSNLLERSQHLTLCDEEKLSPGYANNTTEFSKNVDITSKSVSMPMVQMISCTEKECDSDSPSQGQPCITPSSCVDVFLADPSENGVSPSGSPDFCLKRTGKLPQNVHGDSGGTNENEMRYCQENLAQAHHHTSAVLVKKFKDEHTESSRFSDLCDSYANQATSSQVLNNDSVSLRETIMDCRASNHKKFLNTKAIASLGASHQAEHSLANMSFSNEPVEVNVISTNEQVGPLLEIGTTNTGSSTIPASGTQEVQNLMSPNETDNPLESKAKNCKILVQGKENPISRFSAHGTEVRLLTAKIAQFGELNCTPQLHLGSPHNIQAGGSHLKDLGEMSSVSLGNQIPYDQEVQDGAQAAQHQRGKRKRLRFEAVENHKMSVECEGNSWDFPSDASHEESPATSLELESVNVTQAESTTPVNMLLIQTDPGFSVKVDRAGQYKGSSPILAPRPSGIGLHLNSIGSTILLSCNLNMKLLEGVQGENHPDRVKNQALHDLNSCVSSASLTGYQSVQLTATSEGPSPCSATANSEEKQHGYQALIPNTYVNYQSPLCVKPPEGSLQIKLFDRCLTPCDMKRLPSEDVCRSEESTQTSPRKKRKKTPETEGSRGCNCKRSKCLKLYCDCFAAGALCSEACSCQECFNKSKYKETVQETRKQIESRNPLAFAPRVVLRVAETAKDCSYAKHITPTSARHKRGCNCKKSQCLKKYCECFQAGVGCSLGCRCEGCKNTFGSKDGCGEISEVVVEHKKCKEGEWDWDPSSGGTEIKRKPAAIKQNCSWLSPLTPLVHASSKTDISQFPASYYPSPDSSASVLLPYEGSPSSAMNSVCDSSFAREVEGNLALVPCNPDLDFEYHTTGKVESLSPGWDGFPDICNISPLPNPSPTACGSSCASKTRDPKDLQTRLFQGSGRISPGSLRWRSSPVTPLPRFNESKLPQEPDSDSGVHFEHEDDTPEILKDTRLPIKAVKATSPNQKRVSPPHKAPDELRSNSPAGLKSGRRFILRPVSAMASLTPCSKNSRGEDT